MKSTNYHNSLNTKQVIWTAPIDIEEIEFIIFKTSKVSGPDNFIGEFAYFLKTLISILNNLLQKQKRRKYIPIYFMKQVLPS